MRFTIREDKNCDKSNKLNFDLSLHMMSRCLYLTLFQFKFSADCSFSSKQIENESLNRSGTQLQTVDKYLC